MCRRKTLPMTASSALIVSHRQEPEPEDLELKAPKKKKQPGKKAADIAGLTVKRIDHYLKEEELTAEFGENGWKQLPDAISRCYQFIPASVVIEEHHIGVYSSKTGINADMMFLYHDTGRNELITSGNGIRKLFPSVFTKLSRQFFLFQIVINTFYCQPCLCQPLFSWLFFLFRPGA